MQFPCRLQDIGGFVEKRRVKIEDERKRKLHMSSNIAICHHSEVVQRIYKNVTYIFHIKL